MKNDANDILIDFPPLARGYKWECKRTRRKVNLQTKQFAPSLLTIRPRRRRFTLRMRAARVLLTVAQGDTERGKNRVFSPRIKMHGDYAEIMIRFPFTLGREEEKSHQFRSQNDFILQIDHWRRYPREATVPAP